MTGLLRKPSTPKPASSCTEPNSNSDRPPQQGQSERATIAGHSSWVGLVRMGVRLATGFRAGGA